MGELETFLNKNAYDSLLDSFTVNGPLDIIGLDDVSDDQIRIMKDLSEEDFESFIQELLTNNPYGLKKLFDFFKNNLDFPVDSFQYKLLVSCSVGLVANE